MPPMHPPPKIAFLLDDLQSPINIGQCARTAEVYGIELFIDDPRRITSDPRGVATISDFSCGAWQRRAFKAVGGAAAFVRGYAQGRVVATCVSADAAPLPGFEFRPHDLVVFGNEYDGLSAEVMAQADANLYVPMPDVWVPKPRSTRPIDPRRRPGVRRNGVPNLNVAVTAGIVAYAYSCWAMARS